MIFLFFQAYSGLVLQNRPQSPPSTVFSIHHPQPLSCLELYNLCSGTNWCTGLGYTSQMMVTDPVSTKLWFKVMDKVHEIKTYCNMPSSKIVHNNYIQTQNLCKVLSYTHTDTYFNILMASSRKISVTLHKIHLFWYRDRNLDMD